MENLIKDNWEGLNEQIHRTATGVGRSPKDIKLVVVSKKQPIEVVRFALTAGAKDFGENYPEEAFGKIELLRDHPEINWHMIGHLQSRKVPIVARYFNHMHSIDRVVIAEKLNQQLKLENRRLNVMLEMNMSGEESKSGWDASNETNWDNLLPDIHNILALSNLQVVGLMTMPPINIPAETTRMYFQKLKRLQEFLRNKFPTNDWKELSMGTSEDYQIAIESGSTLLRIGKAIFGPRI